MIELSLIKEQKDNVIEKLAKRNQDFSLQINEIFQLDEKRRKLQQEVDEKLSRFNDLNKDIAVLYKSGKKEEADKFKLETAGLKETIQELKEVQKSLELTLKSRLSYIPNIPHDSVDFGKGAEDNTNLHEEGKVPELYEGAQAHWDLAKKFDIIDFDLGAKVSGAGFPFYKGKGAKLQRALISYFLDRASELGYTEVMPPLLVNEDSGFGTGQLPDKDGQMYHTTVDNLYLIPTAEVPITNIFRNVILKESDFPVKYVGYTPCFRREAGSYGKDVRGLNRLHQFDKVEIVQVQHPDKSYETLDQMVEYVQDLIRSLGLPFRSLKLCGGDMGTASAKTIDLEVYSAAQKKWLEVSSVSNFETYQSNRLKLRFKNTDGKSVLAHTLNGSALALPRILAAILENNQSAEGISIPEVLRKYTGFDKISE